MRKTVHPHPMLHAAAAACAAAVIFLPALVAAADIVTAGVPGGAQLA